MTHALFKLPGLKAGRVGRPDDLMRFPAVGFSHAASAVAAAVEELR